MILCILEKLQSIKIFKCIYLKLRAIKRAKIIKKNKKKIPPYLKNNNFEEELNYKLWSTKGARFNASRRNQILQNLSSKAIGYLSAYLIIIGIINLYKIDLFGIKILDNQVGFISTAFSVLILLFSQLESSENFSLKSEKHHNCSLDIAELYNRTRYVKSYNTNPQDKQQNLQKISNEYDAILKKYENHLPIDYLMFQITKPEYYGIGKLRISYIRFRYYINVYILYHILIFGPIIILIIFSNLIK
ncbi:SLATT domain-containing protein [Flavobacterium johnsoniae]|jgi:hypothetical protein|uniref:SLATT domain-containing protein n=1 Tax=Flavobacterium johnsoniae TaxID=986 RepID=UPI0011EE8B2A|nr:SLATT domain-containing protein [Flavobacterium johnsoniae]